MSNNLIEQLISEYCHVSTNIFKPVDILLERWLYGKDNFREICSRISGFLQKMGYPETLKINEGRDSAAYDGVIAQTVQYGKYATNLDYPFRSEWANEPENTNEIQKWIGRSTTKDVNGNIIRPGQNAPSTGFIGKRFKIAETSGDNAKFYLYDDYNNPGDALSTDIDLFIFELERGEKYLFANGNQIRTLISSETGNMNPDELRQFGNEFTDSENRICCSISLSHIKQEPGAIEMNYNDTDKEVSSRAKEIETITTIQQFNDNRIKLYNTYMHGGLSSVKHWTQVQDGQQPRLLRNNCLKIVLLGETNPNSTYPIIGKPVCKHLDKEGKRNGPHTQNAAETCLLTDYAIKYSFSGDTKTIVTVEALKENQIKAQFEEDFFNLPKAVQNDLLSLAKDNESKGYNYNDTLWDAACAVMRSKGLPNPPHP